VAEPLISEKNPLLKDIRRATQQGGLTGDGWAVAEGPHLLEEAVRSGVEIKAVVVAESARVKLPPSAGRVAVVKDPVFAGLTSTEAPQGVLTLVKPGTWTFPELMAGRALVVVLDGIQDPGNAGAILRAAEAFGATGAVFLKGTVNPYNPKCLRASAGSIFRLPLRAGITPDVFFQQCKLPLYSAEPRAARLAADADFDTPCAIVIGSEGRGVSAAVSAKALPVRIPTSQVESLNAAVAAGVLFYEARRQRGL
jgi:RNA methyltransferase, TrmH family